MPKSKSLKLLFQKSNHEQFAQVAHEKRVTVNDLLRLLMTKGLRERLALFHERVTLSLKKNERIAQKTCEQIPNPALIRR